MKEHFKLEEWADLARNVAKPEAAAKLRQHLDAGCSECIEAFASMSAVAAMAMRQERYEPPAELVRSAQALAAQTVFQGHKGEFMELVFDSFLQPATAGVRGARHAARQVLYQKGTCCIDIRLEHDTKAKKLNVMGQVLDSGESGRGVGSILVEVVQGEKPVATATTNSYGEFELSVANGGGVELCFGVSSSNCFWVKIPPIDQIPSPGTVLSS